MPLTEEVLSDERTGRITNPSLPGYPMPVDLDAPDIEIVFNNIPDPHAPANAVYHATGKRIRSLPITLGKLL